MRPLIAVPLVQSAGELPTVPSASPSDRFTASKSARRRFHLGRVHPVARDCFRSACRQGLLCGGDLGAHLHSAR